MKRRTIDFPDELYKKIQQIRGNKIAQSGKPLPFSKFIVDLVKTALGHQVEKRVRGEARLRVDRVPAMAWCRKGEVCAEATPCEKLECPFKKNKEDVLLGIFHCQTFQLTLPSSTWESAYHLENNLDEVSEE